ncbi:YCII-related protein [Thioalkalivibrio sp. K90mix]|uniref:YciI family protein n=1 Tax=Thioalkalivibrio sp. (strain K90mix) TaxID=396595 RepID=UPI000195A6F2|nr:YciI family protein [Thioalkalivibrio sp. K90mix]ADC72025.1 YCII-related protein [Thioalkalivibrio sp. K90mix]
MNFLLLILEDHGNREARSDAEGQALYAEMLAFGAELDARGQLLASESLRPDRHGVRIRSDEGKTRFIDGPFIESREMIGGFFLIDCADRDEAVEWATRCPAARFATVEVRECAPCHQR